MTSPAPHAAPGRGRGRSASVRLLLGMLRGAVVGSHLALAAGLAVAGLWAGGQAAANLAVGGALVIVFFASGQAVQLVVAEMADGLGMTLVMLSYLLRVVALGLVLWLAMGHQERLGKVFHPGWFFAGAMACLVGWVAGILTAHARAQVPVFDTSGPVGGTV